MVQNLVCVFYYFNVGVQVGICYKNWENIGLVGIWKKAVSIILRWFLLIFYYFNVGVMEKSLLECRGSNFDGSESGLHILLL
jgi:hypothetical protein